MNCYKAVPLGREAIRNFIRQLKRDIGLENELYFPIIQFLENILPILVPDFQLEILTKEEMGNKHGETYPSKNLIRIREDVYLRAVQGKGRDRLTVAHEIGHLFVHGDDAVALCRLAPGEKLKPFEDPEWQADAFGGELLASSYLIEGMSATESSVLANANAMKRQYPLTKSGYFGDKGKNCRIITSASPETTSIDFYRKLGMGGTTKPLSNGKDTITTLGDGTRIVHRIITSTKRSPAVEISISGSSKVKNQKIHFISEED